MQFYENKRSRIANVLMTLIIKLIREITLNIYYMEKIPVEKIAIICLSGITAFIALDLILPNIQIDVKIKKKFLVISGSLITSACIMKILNK